MYFFTLFCFFSCLLHSNEEELEKKIGQLLIPYLPLLEEDDYQKFIEEYSPAGVILYQPSCNLHSKQSVYTLTQKLQLAAINANIAPLFISIDQEGGAVFRLSGEFTHFPGARALGEIKDLKEAENLSYLSHKSMGHELLNVGINMNFAPVVDIETAKKNPVIGIRSFGKEPMRVSALGKKAIQGLLDSGMIGCLKHFPGHGDVSTDTHYQTATIYKTKEELKTKELIPFYQIASPMIMVGHLMIPKLDPNNPASTSHVLIEELLRKELGYQGVVISDSITMKGMPFSMEEASVKAIQAGCDLVIIGRKVLNSKEEQFTIHTDKLKRYKKELKSIQKALVYAVKTGKIKQERLEEAISRVKSLKKRFNIGLNPIKLNQPNQQEKSLQLYSKQIAKKSVSTNFDQKKICLKNIFILCPKQIETIVEDCLPKGLERKYFNQNLSKQEIKKLLNEYSLKKEVLFFSYNAWKNQSQKSLLKAVSKKYSITLVALGSSEDTSLIDNAFAQISTYSPSKASVREALSRIIFLD